LTAEPSSRDALLTSIRVSGGIGGLRKGRDVFLNSKLTVRFLFQIRGWI
jgi:hypothetical protein